MRRAPGWWVREGRICLPGASESSVAHPLCPLSTLRGALPSPHPGCSVSSVLPFCVLAGFCAIIISSLRDNLIFLISLVPALCPETPASLPWFDFCPFCSVERAYLRAGGHLISAVFSGLILWPTLQDLLQRASSSGPRKFSFFSTAPPLLYWDFPLANFRCGII